MPTTLAGQVWDRITGRAVQQATIVAVSNDSLVHRSTADRTGIFAFRYLPAGTFDVTAFEDQNRNGEVDSTEVQGLIPLFVEEGDTVLTEISILTPDASEAKVTGAEVLDSVTLALLFDDFLDFETGVDEVEIEISPDADDTPMIVDVMHEPDYVVWVERVTDSLSRLDSIEAEEVAALRLLSDVEAVMPSEEGSAIRPEELVLASARRPPPSLPQLQGSAAGPTADGARVLPGRRLILRLSVPLPYEIEFALTVSGVTNIFGLPGGGGEATLSRELVVDSVMDLDSMGVSDSIAALDTGVVTLIGVAGAYSGCIFPVCY